MDIFVARQPIFNTRKNVYGYELLFRDGLKNAFPDIDGDVATLNVLSNTFFSFELKEILQNRPGFINFTRDLLLKKTPRLFPREHVIIEVLEDIEPEPELIETLSELRKTGYRIALDDFLYDEKFNPMIRLSHIIKLDFRTSSENEIQQTINSIKGDSPVKFLAEKIETYDEFQYAKELGFQLFQGYFFSKPEVLSKKDITSNQVVKLKLITELQRRDIDLVRIEDLIKKDVGISYKLLKFINSAYFKTYNPINTIKDAINYLGIDELKKFISVIAVSDLNREKPNELIRRSVVRARMCEKLGTMVRTDFSNDELFTLGLFSFMDALLDHDMEEVLKVIGFSEHLNDALLGSNRNFNTMLNIINSFEKGEWNKKVLQMISGRTIESKLPMIYFDSIRMANSCHDST
ncbi:MAG: HDOD domain-containing protein [Desulfobacteraceae bacterium]|nr:MAG: HDOD domain-containing protein [Desulfobacteraceae bacterium]